MPPDLNNGWNQSWPMLSVRRSEDGTCGLMSGCGTSEFWAKTFAIHGGSLSDTSPDLAPRSEGVIPDLEIWLNLRGPQT